MLNWEEYHSQLMTRIGDVAQLSPDTVKGYATLSGAGAKTNKLDAKVRELIAIAAAVTTRCDGCITVHSTKALEPGTTREELAEAMGDAVALHAGSAPVYSARGLD